MEITENYYSDSSSGVEAICLYLIQKNRKKRKRKCWVRPMFLERESVGEFFTLVPKLQKDLEMFINYYRMTPTCYNIILKHIRPLFGICETNFRKSISLEERLTVTIRYLVTGENSRSISYRFRLGASSITSLVEEMLKLIYKALHGKYLKFPSKHEWLRIAKTFHRHNLFPNCIGALFGKQIRLNKKKAPIVLFALADISYKFTMIEVGPYENVNNRGVFDNGQFDQLLYQRMLPLPDDKPLEEGGQSMPFVVIASEAFKLSENVMKPYTRRVHNKNKQIFIHRITHARKMVDSIFEMVVSKFRVLDTNLIIASEKVEDVVRATCLLHNVIRTVDFDQEHTQEIDGDVRGLDDFQYYKCASHSSKDSRHVRETFMNYLCDAGAVPGQVEAVTKNFSSL